MLIPVLIDTSTALSAGTDDISEGAVTSPGSSGLQERKMITGIKRSNVFLSKLLMNNVIFLFKEKQIRK